MPDQDNTEDTEAGIWVDGQRITMDEFTFREQRQVREHVRALAPGNDIDKADLPDYFPAMICVFKQRDEPGFTLDQALDFKPVDLQRPTDPTPPPAEQ